MLVAVSLRTLRLEIATLIPLVGGEMRGYYSRKLLAIGGVVDFGKFDKRGWGLLHQRL